jgi:hypothetical protein
MLFVVHDTRSCCSGWVSSVLRKGGGGGGLGCRYELKAWNQGPASTVLCVLVSMLLVLHPVFHPSKWEGGGAK